MPLAPVYAVFAVAELVAGLVNGPYGPVEFAVLLTVALVITVEATRFCLGIMGGLGQRRHHFAEQMAVFVLALAALAYILTRTSQGFSWVLLPAVLAGAIVATAEKRLRWGLAIGTTASVPAVGTTINYLGYGIFPSSLWFGFFGTFAVAFTISILLVQAWLWDVVLELDRARSVSAELAVTRERLRFADELHDVQGHHLQAIALKGELAERLIGIDDDAARAQATETAELARAALRDTREIVHGYRRSDLPTELDNTRQIMEAAGITTTVAGDPRCLAPPLQPLFAALVREGVTNILRHSHAQQCEITITATDRGGEVLLRNDGLRENGDILESGIEGLRQRFATLGGYIHAGRRNGWFELFGRAEEPGKHE